MAQVDEDLMVSDASDDVTELVVNEHLDQLAAIEWIYHDPNGMINGRSEWIEAALWSAVCSIMHDHMNGTTTWNSTDLDEVLRMANLS